jgi:hypothetical protein
MSAVCTFVHTCRTSSSLRLLARVVVCSNAQTRVSDRRMLVSALVVNRLRPCDGRVTALHLKERATV